MIREKYHKNRIVIALLLSEIPKQLRFFKSPNLKANEIQ